MDPKTDETSHGGVSNRKSFRHYERRAALQGTSEDNCFERTRETNRSWIERTLTADMPISHSDYTSIGTSRKRETVGVFRELFAHWVLAGTDVPDDLHALVAEYAAHARSDGFFRMLETCWRIVLDFCRRWSCEALPMSVGAAIGLIISMAAAGYSFGYIRNVKTTISTAHRLSRLADPTKDACFQVIFDCIARRLGRGCPNAKAAMFVDELRKLGAHYSQCNDNDAVQKWAIILFTYFSTFRRMNVAEFVRSNARDRGEFLELTLPKSKTDQYREGRMVYIYALPRDPEICPLRAYRRWVERLDYDYPGGEGTLFRHLGPLATITEKPLADRTIARTVQDAAALIGLDPTEYGAQSARAGMITEALMNGVDEIPLAEHTGHFTLESLRRYYRPKNRRINFSEAAVHGTPRNLSPA